MRLTRKKFLSESPDETGFIVITASSPRVEYMKENSWYRDNTTVEAQVQVGDCSHKVYLSFDVNSEEDLKKRIDKLNIMIDHLTELRDTLPYLWDDAKINATAYKELNKDEEDEKQKSSD